MQTRYLPASIRGAATLAACLLALSSSVVAVPATQVSAPRTFVENVRLAGFEEPVSILLSDGRIEAVLDAGPPAPPGVKRVDGAGRLAVPGFLDASTRKGLEAPEPNIDQDQPVDTGRDVRIDMRRANRKGIRPAFAAAEALTVKADDAKAWQEAGFGAAVASPRGELLAGRSVLIAARDAAPRDLVLDAGGWPQASFRASGSGYPSTLMGYFAQLRQFFLDVQYHAVLRERYAEGRPGPRPVFDAELDAGLAILAGDRSVYCQAQSHRDAERWLKLGAELGFPGLALVGGRDLWRVADVLAAADVPVVLTLDWGDEVKVPKEDEEVESEDDADPDSTAADPDDSAEGSDELAPETTVELIDGPVSVTTDALDETDAAEGEQDEEPADDSVAWTYEAPLRVRREERRLWEEKRDSAIVLREAGVRIAFGTDDAKPAELLKKVRQVVEAGLDRDAALQALTVDAADLFGVEKRLGRIEPGYDATFALWTDHPMAEKAQVAWMFVDGFGTEFEVKEAKGGGDPPAEGVDVTGTWTVKSSDPEVPPATLEVTMEEDGAVAGTYSSRGPGGDELEADLEGRVSGTTFTFEMEMTVGDNFTLSIEGEFEIDGDALTGETTVSGEGFSQTEARTATRNPEEVR